MIERISNWFYRLSFGWVALVGLVIFILFTAIVLPAQTSNMDKDAAQAGSPDLSLFYTPDDLYRMAEAYGQSGRQAFIHTRLTFDVVWPLVYLFFLTTSISWLLKTSLPPDSRLLLLNTVPLLAFLLDFLENFANILVMARYPDPTPVVEWLAPVFTLLKWTMVGASMVILLYALFLKLRSLLRRKSHVA